MPAPHAFYSKMLAERTASRNVFVLFYFIYFIWAGKKRKKKGRRSGGPALVAAARREQLEQALQELKVP
jgi:hypothetical protein